MAKSRSRKKAIKGSPEELRAYATRCMKKARTWINKAYDYEQAACREERTREDKLFQTWPKDQCEACKAGKKCAIHDAKGVK